MKITMNQQKQGNYVEHELITEIVREFSVDALNNILNLEKKCFSKEMQYGDYIANKYYTEVLKDKSCISIFLKENNEIIGYVLATPHNRGFDDLFEYDPYFLKQNNVFYFFEFANKTKRGKHSNKTN